MLSEVMLSSLQARIRCIREKHINLSKYIPHSEQQAAGTRADQRYDGSLLKDPLTSKEHKVKRRYAGEVCELIRDVIDWAVDRKPHQWQAAPASSSGSVRRYPIRF